MIKLRQEFTNSPPLAGSYTPKKGDLCAALFSDDGLWYRAKVDKVQGSQVYITFIDYGNVSIDFKGFFKYNSIMFCIFISFFFLC